MILSLVAFGGCAVSTEPEMQASSDPTPPSPEPAQYVTSTRVTVQADGTLHIEAPVMMTREQMQREVDARRALSEPSTPDSAAPSDGIGQSVQAATVATDGACLGTDDWLYDQPNLEGNRLCVALAPGSSLAQLDLSTVPYCVLIISCHGGWGWKVQSAWGGSSSHRYIWDRGFTCGWMPPQLLTYYRPFEQVPSLPNSGMCYGELPLNVILSN
jgi:hypothetical protein